MDYFIVGGEEVLLEDLLDVVGSVHCGRTKVFVSREDDDVKAEQAVAVRTTNQ